MASAAGGHPKPWAMTPKANSPITGIRKGQSLAAGLKGTARVHLTPAGPVGLGSVTETCLVQSEASRQLGGT